MPASFHRLFLALLVVIAALASRSPVDAAQTTPVNGLQAIAHAAEEGADATRANDITAARAEWDEIRIIWERIEAGVREQDAAAYVELEAALDALKDVISAEPPDADALAQAFEKLERTAGEAAGMFGGTPATATTARPADVRAMIDTAYRALERGNAPQALAEVEEAVALWPAAEGEVAARSGESYETIETNLGRALAALEATPADLPVAESALEQILDALAPFDDPAAYTAFDAAAVLLREGLEALLVIVALLTMLRQSGNADKRGWVWLGGGLGVFASIIAAFALQTIFSTAAAGQNRELIEGVTGLLAAALLFYVSYWLHSKASLDGWRRYIHARTTRVLTSGSIAGLALLAFLAVFREGAETAVFYLGMAPSISAMDLALGFGIGAAMLAAAAALILVAGVRLPLRHFFRIAGLIVYYLGFKFVGAGIHSLQVAGTLPASPMNMPALPSIGIYPTWETLVPQATLLLGALALFLYLRGRERLPQTTSAS